MASSTDVDNVASLLLWLVWNDSESVQRHKNDVKARTWMVDTGN